MDRTTKHRILGILVVIGLVIILLPFLQSEKGLPSEKTALKAPPFPDQAVQVEASAQENQEAPFTPPLINQASEGDVNQLPDDTIRVVRPSVINAKSPPAMQGSMPHSNDHLSSDMDEKVTVEPDAVKGIELPAADTPEKPVHAKMVQNKIVEPGIPQDELPKELRAKPSQMAQEDVANEIGKIKPFIPSSKAYVATNATKKGERSSLTESLDKNGLAKLQEAAWVIQLGSFKNKANALRLVNQLRSNGYSAFIQEVSTSFGDSTRVFVGPESKHTVARELASRLESDLHIHGIVISYKPLSL